jgi:hypothetical protein
MVNKSYIQSKIPSIVTIVWRILLTCLPVVAKERIFLLALATLQRYYVIKHFNYQEVQTAV